jgi:hypothetical protein
LQLQDTILKDDQHDLKKMVFKVKGQGHSIDGMLCPCFQHIKELERPELSLPAAANKI